MEAEFRDIYVRGSTLFDENFNILYDTYVLNYTQNSNKCNNNSNKFFCIYLKYIESKWLIYRSTLRYELA